MSRRAFLILLSFLLMAAVPSTASAAAPDCTEAHNDRYQAGLGLTGLPQSLAYGRRADAAVEVSTSLSYIMSEPAYVTVKGDREVTGRTRTMPGDQIGGMKFPLRPKRSRGSVYTVSLSFVEEVEAYEPDGTFKAPCRRVETRTVRAVDGEAPKIGFRRRGAAGRRFTLSNPGYLCSRTKPGRLRIAVVSPGATRTLSLSDPCKGRWGATARGRGWTLAGGAHGLRPTADFSLDRKAADAELDDFRFVVSFRGRVLRRLG